MSEPKTVAGLPIQMPAGWPPQQMPQQMPMELQRALMAGQEIRQPMPKPRIAIQLVNDDKPDLLPENPGLIAFCAVFNAKQIDGQTAMHGEHYVQVQTVDPLYGWSAPVLTGVQILVLVWSVPEEFGRYEIIGWHPYEPTLTFPLSHHKFNPYNVQPPRERGDSNGDLEAP